MDKQGEKYLTRLLSLYEENIPKWEETIKKTIHEIETLKQKLSMYNKEVDEMELTMEDLKKILAKE